jgi:hypothetical protein
MTRLSQELQRLFPAADADGRLRTLVLALRAPADWSALGRVWQGVQADLDWPAPAIAVSGSDGVQLWFALQQPVDAATGAAVLQALVQRWLAELPPHRLCGWPGAAGAQAPVVPALLGQGEDGERWSAFVSADLAPMFSDTPWLEMPPNPDGQAALLAPLRAITPEELQRLPGSVAAVPPVPPVLQPAAAPATVVSAVPAPTGTCTDPRQFLLGVMNDAAVPLALRIEAAKALLPPR